MQSKNTPTLILALILLAAGTVTLIVALQSTYEILTPISILTLLAGIVIMGLYLNSLFTGRSSLEDVNSAISIIIFLAIVVFLEMFLTRNSMRIDLTESKKFTLATQTTQLLKGIKEPVTMLYLENPMDPQSTIRVKDLLDLYQHYSSQVKYEVIDPEKEPLKVQALAPVSYGALYVMKGDTTGRVDPSQEQEVPHEKVSPVDENNLTNALMKLLKGESRVVYFTTGHEERSTEDREVDGMNFMKQMMEEEGYQCKDLQLATVEHVPEDAVAVIIAGPKTPFFETEIQTLNDYLTYGGKLIAMLDPQTDTGLEQFFEENFGVHFGNDYVVENNPLMRVFGGSPIAPMIGELGTHAIVEPFGNMTPGIMFEMVQSVDLKDDLPEGVTGTEIIKTGAQSWAERDIEALKTSGQAGYDDGEDMKGPVPIAVALSKPAEKRISDATDEAAKEEVQDENVEELEQQPETRIVLYGDSDFAANRNYRSSLNLFLNSINWLAQQEDLISIRPKDDSGRPVMVTQFQARMLFITSLILLPLLVAIFGVVVWTMKRLRG